MSLQFEVGKYYRTRNGHKAFVTAVETPGPHGELPEHPVHGFYFNGGWRADDWTSLGNYYDDHRETDFDLVSLWHVELSEQEKQRLEIVRDVTEALLNDVSLSCRDHPEANVNTEMEDLRQALQQRLDAIASCLERSNG